MSDKAITVLKHLLSGEEIEHPDGKTYLFSDGNELCVKAHRYVGDKPVGVVYLKVNFGDLNLQDFIDWARKIPDDYITTMQANAALRSLRRER